jgi:membrane protease YdiL (CAAX protease family)
LSLWSEGDSSRAAAAEQPAFFFFSLLLLGRVTLGSLVQTASVPFGLAFSEVFFFAVPALLFCVGANFQPARFLALRRPSVRLIGLGAIVGGANFLVAGSLQLLGRAAFPEMAKAIDPLRLFRDMGPVESVLLVCAVGLFAPVCEEIAFRGYLQTIFGARYRAVASLVVGGLLFSLLHLDPLGFAALAELGMLFGLLALWSKSIWPGVAAHAVNNLIGSLAMVVARDRPRPAPTDLGKGLLAGAIALAATVALLAAFRLLARREPAESGEPWAPCDPETGHDFSWEKARRLARATSLAAAVSLALFGGLFWRTAATNYIDAFAPGSRLEKRIPDPEARAQVDKRLKGAREQALGGKATLGRYSDLRKALLGHRPPGAPTLALEDVEQAFAAFEGSARSAPAPLP